MRKSITITLLERSWRLHPLQLCTLASISMSLFLFFAVTLHHAFIINLYLPLHSFFPPKFERFFQVVEGVVTAHQC